MARVKQRTVHLPDISEATLTSLLPSWVRSLEAENRTVYTIRSYRAAVRRLALYLASVQRDETVASITKQDMQGFLAHILATGTPNSARSYCGTLIVFFKWAITEGELKTSPLDGITRPHVPEQPPDVLSDDQLRALLKTCSGPDFNSRRDLAIIRLLIDTGMRRSEMAGLTLPDLNLKENEATVLGKGRRHRTVRYRSKAAAALDRYLRVRERHPDHELPAVWLGRYGPLGHVAIYDIVRKRGRQAGIPRNIWPHLFRHGFSHQWLSEGGSEGGLMRLAGWRSRAMIDRYGASVAAERARDEASRLKLGDRL